MRFGQSNQGLRFEGSELDSLVGFLGDGAILIGAGDVDRQIRLADLVRPMDHRRKVCHRRKVLLADECDYGACRAGVADFGDVDGACDSLLTSIGDRLP